MTRTRRPSAFPRLRGMSLSRKRMIIPEDLEGNINLVLVAFRRHHQRDVDEWLHDLGDIEERIEDLCIYEVPLLVRYPRFYRRWIDDGMRSGIPDPETRDRTITVYTDRRRFLDHFDLPDESQILVALLDGKGAVVWSHVGPPSESAIEELIDLVGRLQREAIRDR